MFFVVAKATRKRPVIFLFFLFFLFGFYFIQNPSVVVRSFTGHSLLYSLSLCVCIYTLYYLSFISNIGKIRRIHWDDFAEWFINPENLVVIVLITISFHNITMSLLLQSWTALYYHVQSFFCRLKRMLYIRIIILILLLYFNRDTIRSWERTLIRFK